MTLDDLERTMTAYAEAVRSGAAGEAGWPAWINIPSKIRQVAATRMLARSAEAE